jgi:23S rRNA (cytosine1962-C5)-methyltransferase
MYTGSIDIIAMKTFKLIIKKNKEFSLLKGHPWAYKEAFKSIPDELKTGDTVEVYSHKNVLLGKGYADIGSKILVRIINCKPNQSIEEGIKHCLKSALELRQIFFNEKRTNSFRLINGEGDGIPGLIIDRYADALSMQIYSLGLEPYISLIKDEVLKLLPKTRWIWRRNQIRLANSIQEGLIYGKNLPSKIVFKENNLRFYTDLINGQKTGFFLDQRANRALIRSVARGRAFLNICGYTGAFTVAAVAGGANKSVTVDVAQPALEEAQRNLELNKLNSAAHKIVCQDMYEYLENSKEGAFDLIVLDPPSMAKNKRDVPKASKAYLKLNILGLKKIKAGGLLYTASCSSQIGREEFLNIVRDAVFKSGRSAKIVHESFHGPDHPMASAHTEGRYLKGILLKVD